MVQRETEEEKSAQVKSPLRQSYRYMQTEDIDYIPPTMCTHTVYHSLPYNLQIHGARQPCSGNKVWVKCRWKKKNGKKTF